MNETPFATPDDLADRWRPLTPLEQERAGVLLGDASTILRAECPSIDDRLAAYPPLLDPTLVTFIVCQMVKRAMVSADAGEGITQQSQTAGPFTSQVSFVNPTGAVYVTKAERKLLGCGGQEAFTVPMVPVDDVRVHAPWCSLRFGALDCSCGSDLNREQGPIFGPVEVP